MPRQGHQMKEVEMSKTGGQQGRLQEMHNVLVENPEGKEMLDITSP